MERAMFVRKMFYFIELSMRRKTGTKKELASRLSMSESGIKRMIVDLRDAGFLIEYDRDQRTYKMCKQAFKQILPYTSEY